MSKSDPIVLSYEDSLIRESDLKLLDSNGWINDSIISFWFTYLKNKYDKYDDLFCFIYPELVQMLGSKSSQHEAGEMLKDDFFQKKQIWFLPINNADVNGGGTHWSLLVLNRKDPIEFEHYDSLNYSENRSIAKMVIKALYDVLCKELKLNYDLTSGPIEMDCIIKQTNSYDCGVHLLVNVEALINVHIYKLSPMKNFFQFSNLEIVLKTREKIKKIIYQLKEENDNK